MHESTHAEAIGDLDGERSGDRAGEPTGRRAPTLFDDADAMADERFLLGGDEKRELLSICKSANRWLGCAAPVVGGLAIT